MAKSVPERKAPIFHGVRFIAKIFLSQVFKISVDGQGNLPTKTAFILLPKHQRWEDIPLLSLGTPRPLHYMAKYELFSNPVSRWFLSALGGIPLNRSRPLESRQSLKTMLDLLERGEGVVIFPEGTYYRNKMGPGHVGLIRMLISRSAAPFIPVGVNYGAKGPRTMVKIHFGAPIYAGSLHRAKSLLHEIMQEIARLSGL